MASNSYKARMNVVGNTFFDRRLNTLKSDFDNLVKDVGVSITFNEESDSEKIVIRDIANIEHRYDAKSILCRHDSTRKLGDYFNWSNHYWTLLEEDIKSLDGFKKFFAYKNNNFLNFYDEFGVIHSIPCVLRYISRSSIGAKQSDDVNLSNRLIEIEVQQNEFTEKITENDEVKIMLGDTPFKLFNTNKYMKPGLMILSVEQFEFSEEFDKQIEHDGRNIWVGNYESIPTFTLTLSGNNSNLSIGDTLQTSYTLVDNNGQTFEDTIIYTTSDEDIATVSSDGLITGVANGSCIITATMENNSSVTSSINIQITDVITNNYTYEISPNVSKLYRNQTQTYTVYQLNNGTRTDVPFTITINSDTTSPSNKYELSNTDNSFTVKNLGYNGKIVLNINPTGFDSFTKTINTSKGY